MALVIIELNDPEEANVVLSALAAFRKRAHEEVVSDIPTREEVALYSENRVKGVKAYRARLKPMPLMSDAIRTLDNAARTV